MIGRRGFLLGSAAVAGGLAVGYRVLTAPLPNPVEPDEGEAALNPYVLVTREGVTVIAPRAEMGQGVQTTLAALVAEEMDLDWSEVRAVHGPASLAYANSRIIALGLPFADYRESWVQELAEGAMELGARLMAMQLTGGSTSTADAFERMRRAGAAARVMLVEAAARRWDLPAARLRTEAGAVLAPDGARLSYPDLAEAAAALEAPRDPPLKPRAAWRLLGRSLPRLDMADKVTGQAEFATDVRLDGALFATVRTNPHLGAPMLRFDAAEAERMPDVVRVLDIGNGIAVVARTTWAAMQAAERVEVDWADAPYPSDTDAIFAGIAAAFDAPTQMALRDDGDVDAALADPRALRAEYRAPYLAHTTMEPMTASALYSDSRLILWAGTQSPTRTRESAAEVAGLAPEAVEIVTTYLGGGFGRRAEFDFTDQAARIAVAMPGTPIKMTWRREEDVRHDWYRPGAIARLVGLPGPRGPEALKADIAAPSIAATQIVRQAGMAPPGPDKFLVEGCFDQPYAIPAFRVQGHVANVAVPIGFWRSVGHSHNTFFTECFLDELAHAGGQDPVAMRLGLMRDEHAASARVLRTVAEMSGWGTPLPDGVARGVAFCFSYGSPTAQVVQVRQTDRGLRVERIWCAIDVGIALDPRNIEAQIQSGIIYGLSATIMGQITFAGGRVEQSNFHDCEVLRMDQCPAIETRILESGESPGGVGEPGTPPVAPALANAVFALTGRRIRQLPLVRELAFA
ncbi:xanthine dehydrogenase family protein molybdopterin-binding subunit [Roseitranquillus sediminis]|uniref:xanthine dehydrogenase family protein molybdopterin-binding subunit n=1 Tax=Roseitranquillus sediminis TaxID=2809051 RepID=UPI001D0C82FD|nr:molybdopterin cofactor-binding domain-containing protein [Roseitranquillus sediminis]MBM9595178.1 xanthine dehydrogenase family protein molybdopterin-binding subunit [Roseitranquillus sediminis]